MAPLSSILAASLAAAGLVAAAPTKQSAPVSNKFGESGAFSVKQVRNAHHVRSGPLSVYKTYLKFGKTPPAELAAFVANISASHADFVKRTTGSVVTTPSDSFDDEYVTPVQIGTPAQTLNLDFDTGSSDLWVFSSETPSSQRAGHNTYKPSSSSTSKKLSGYTWSISYGDGSSSSGDVYTDVVTVGGLSVTKQAVESAQTVSSQFQQDTAIDGLLGLGFESLNTVSPTQQNTFFGNAISQLDQPLFTADLKHNAPGHYNFGYIDSSAYTGTIYYTSVSTNPGYWTWTSTGYAVGSASFKSTSINGIADTGTTLLYLPSSILSAYYSKVSGAKNSGTYGGYVFPCSATLPTFTFGVGSGRITIPGSYMNYGPVQTGSSTCFGGLQDSSSIGINIFGDVALKAAFVVFNGGSSPKLGWAAKSL